MAKVRVMYWKEIPVQVQARDAGAPPVAAPLDARFQQGVDAIAMFDGSMGSDDYLMAWEWHEYGDVAGAAQDAAEAVASRFNEGFPADFVARIRDLIHERIVYNCLFIPADIDVVVRELSIEYG